MPQAIPMIAAAFATVASAATAFAATLTFSSGLMAGLAAWGKVAMWVALGASLLMKPPGLESAGQQVNIQLAGPNAPIPIIFGRTGTQGMITYRDTGGGSSNPILWVDQVLSVGPINRVVSFSVMDRSLGFSGNPSTGVGTITSVSGVNMRDSKLFREDGFKVAHRVGAFSDNATLSTIFGEQVGTSCPINSTHKMAGLAHTAMRLKLDGKQLNFPDGFPDNPVSVVEGVLCYDPRLDSTRTDIGGQGPHRLNDLNTRTWSENPYIVGLNFALGFWSPNGKMVGLGAEIDNINVAQWAAAANYADSVGWKVGGQVTTADGRWAILTNILAAGGGVPLNLDGRLGCFVRSPKVSTFTLKRDEVLGTRKITTSTPISQRANRIIPSCRSAAHGWDIIAGDAISDPSWLEQDHGDLRTTETTFPLVQDFRQAHQLAAYEICDAREFLELEVTAKPRALNAEVGDCISVDLPEFQPGQKWIVLDRKWESTSKVVTLVLKSETHEKHAFALGQSQTAPAPPTLVTFDPTNPDAPASTSWAITDNKIIGTRRYDVTPPVAEGEPPVPEEDRVYEDRDHSQIPALVIAGEVNDPNVVKTVVEIRPYTDASTLYPNGVPNGIDAAALADQVKNTGWTHAAEGNQTVTQFVLAPLRANTRFQVSITYQTNNGAFSQRTLIGDETTAEDIAGNVGPGTVDWNDPDGTGPIIGRPPILNPGDPGYLDAGSLRWADDTLGNALVLIETALGDLDNAVTELSNVVVDVDGAVANATAGLVVRIDAAEDLAEAARDRADGVWSVVGENDGSGLRSQIVALQNSTVGDVTAVTERVDGLEQIVNATGAQALARIKDIDALETAIDGTYAKASTINDLNTRVTTAEGVNTSQNTRLNTAETNIAGKANAADLNSLTTRVTTAEGVNAAQNVRLNTAESDIAGKASASDLSNLSGVVTGQGQTIGGHATRLTTAEANIAGKANASDLVNLTGRVTAAEGENSAQNLRLNTAEADIAGKASASDLAALNTRITTAEGVNSAQNIRLNTAENDIAGKASASSVLSLTTRVGNAETTITSHNGRLDTAESDIAGKASSSALTTLSNEIVTARNGGATLKGRIDGLQTSLTDAINLKASASSVMTLQSEIDSARAGRPNLRATIDFLYSTTVDGLAGKAESSLVNSINATVGGFDSRITSAANVAASADGRVRNMYGVVQDVNGYVTGFSSENTGASSAFRVRADKFEVRSPSGGGIDLINGTMKLYDTAGRKRFVFGSPNV